MHVGSKDKLDSISPAHCVPASFYRCCDVLSMFVFSKWQRVAHFSTVITPSWITQQISVENCAHRSASARRERQTMFKIVTWTKQTWTKHHNVLFLSHLCPLYSRKSTFLCVLSPLTSVSVCLLGDICVWCLSFTLSLISMSLYFLAHFSIFCVFSSYSNISLFSCLLAPVSYSLCTLSPCPYVSLPSCLLLPMFRSPCLYVLISLYRPVSYPLCLCVNLCLCIALSPVRYVSVPLSPSLLFCPDILDAYQSGCLGA